jgi:hypothetical protein
MPDESSREWEVILQGARSERERQQVQLMKLELGIGLMLVSLARTEAALGDPRAAELAAQARAAYDGAKSYAQQLSGEQRAFLEAKLEELRSALESEPGAPVSSHEMNRVAADGEDYRLRIIALPPER